MEKPAFEKILQINMVVDDIDAYVRRFNDEYGIGPWTLLTFDEKCMKTSHIEGKPEPFAIRLALCDALNIQLELLQPISGDTTYSRFLAEHGPGLHHLAAAPKGGFKVFMDNMAEKGYTSIIGGVDYGGRQFEYLDLQKELGFIVELYNDPPDFKPLPGETYPPQK